MRILFAVIALSISIAPVHAERLPAQPFTSLQDAVTWLNNFRVSHDLTRAPLAIQALSHYGAFKDPEAAGVYVGFIAGLIGSNPDNADRLIESMLPIRSEDEWAIVRGIAYSGAPQWKRLLRKYSTSLPMRRKLIEAYIGGRLATLDALSIDPSPTTLQRIGLALTRNFSSGTSKPASLVPTQTIVDTLWGYFLASGEYRPIMRIVDLLPWSKDRDDVDRLTVGSMARYTLAINAARDPRLLGMLRTIQATKKKAKYDSAGTVKILDEVIEAAEFADASGLRKDAIASIERLKTRGPAYKKELSTWGKIGQGTIAVGCVVAAATGHIEFGLPCVIGGSTASAAMYYMNEK